MKEDKSVEQLKNFILTNIEEKKGEAIKVLDLRKIENAIADYFVICNATSKIHAQTISDHIVRQVRTNLKQRPLSVEGEQNAFWILVDYASVVVHIFLPEYREFYDLEGLWGEVIAEYNYNNA